MITIQTDIEDFEIKDKFSFNSFRRRFKLSTKKNDSSDKKPSTKSPVRKLSFKNLFKSKKKDSEVKFDSGFGEFKEFYPQTFSTNF